MRRVRQWLGHLGLDGRGFALPQIYLTAAGVWSSIGFGIFVIGLSVSDSGQGLSSADIAASWVICSGLVAGSCMMLAGEFKREMRLVIHGMRLSITFMLLFAALIAFSVVIGPVGSIGVGMFLFGIVVFGLGMFIAPFYLPIFVVERRLCARLRAGNPPWHPNLATRGQRSDAVLFMLPSVSAALGFIIAIHRGFMSMDSFNSDNVGSATVTGIIGMLAGYALGFLTAGIVRSATEATDLSRTMPLLIGVMVLPSLAGAVFSITLGVIAAFVATLVAGKVAQHRYQLPELGDCPTCGYNLADMIWSRCPECGHLLATKPIHAVPTADR